MLSYRALLAFFLNMYQNTSICFTYQAYKATGVDFDTTAILGAVFFLAVLVLIAAKNYL